MVIKEDKMGGIQEISMYMDDVEMLVSAANIAGYLEASEKIYVESDTELAWCLVHLLKAWYRSEEDKSFQEVAQEELMKKFYIE